MYRVGLPLWKLAARVGIPLKLRVYVHFDQESNSFWADSPDLDGLVVSGDNLEELRREALIAADELLTLAVKGHKHTAVASLRLGEEEVCPA